MEVVCAECGAGMVLRESRFGKFFGCSTFPKCSATHGAHPDGRPLGVPGDAATKAARIAAHAEFDTLFESRRQRYAWLARFDTLPDHIGEMTEQQCYRLIAFVRRERNMGDA